MAVKSIEAVYENGIFRPVEEPPSDLSEGQHVHLTVQLKSPEEILELAAQVYKGLAEEEIDEIERIALDRRDFFGSRS